MNDKYPNANGYLDAIYTICEKIDCFDDFDEVYNYLKSKFEELYELENDIDKTINETKKAHEKEIKEKIKEKVESHKEKKAGKEPAAPAKP